MFPLGRCAVSTYEMAVAMDLDFLLVIPRVFVFLALGAWTVTFAARLRWLWCNRAESVDRRSAAT